MKKYFVWMRNGELIFGIVLILFGVFTRIFQFNRLGYWIDELFSITLSSQNFSSMFSDITMDIHPPIYQLLLWFWVFCFGNSPESGRLFSVLFALLLLPLVYYGTKSILNGTQRLLLLAMTVFSSGYILYAHETRSYSLLIFCTALIFLLFLRQIELGISFKSQSIFLLLSLFTENIHYFGFIFVHLLWVFYLVFVIKKYWSENQRLVWQSIFCYIIISLGFGWEIYKILFVISKSAYGNWIPEPNSDIYIHFFSYLYYFLPYKRIPLLVLFVILLILPIPFFIKQNFRIEFKKQKDKFFLTLGFCSLFLLLTFIVSLYKPMVTSRNLLVLSFPFYICFTIWISLMTSVWRPKYVLSLVTLSFLLSYLSFAKFYYKDFQKEPWREMTNKAIELSQDSTLYYSFGTQSFWNYYMKDVNKKSGVMEMLPTSESCREILKVQKEKNVKQLFVFETMWDGMDSEKIKNQRMCLDQISSLSKNQGQYQFIVMTLWMYEF